MKETAYDFDHVQQHPATFSNKPVINPLQLRGLIACQVAAARIGSFPRLAEMCPLVCRFSLPAPPAGSRL